MVIGSLGWQVLHDGLRAAGRPHAWCVHMFLPKRSKDSTRLQRPANCVCRYSSTSLRGTTFEIVHHTCTLHIRDRDVRSNAIDRLFGLSLAACAHSRHTTVEEQKEGWEKDIGGIGLNCIGRAVSASELRTQGTASSSLLLLRRNIYRVCELCLLCSGQYWLLAELLSFLTGTRTPSDFFECDFPITTRIFF